jgi:hypothetical protein
MASVKVTEAINLIKSTQKTSEIYVPSLRKTLKFKHLTAGQQEKFVQALVDNPGTQSRFTLTLIDIIKENIEDKSVVNQLTVLDRYAIGIGLRVASIGKNLKTEVEAEPGISYTVDLESNLKFVKEKVNHNPFDPITIDDFKIEVQYPTISQEAANERFFKRDESAMDGTPEGVRSIISNAFVGDAMMFMKTLTITRPEGDPLVIDFNAITLQDKLDLVRRLPNTVLEKMLDPMASVKRQIEGMMKGVGVSDVDSKIKRSILIAFDASLFIAAN